MLLFMNKYEIVDVSLQSSIVHVVKYSEKLNNYSEQTFVLQAMLQFPAGT